MPPKKVLMYWAYGMNSPRGLLPNVADLDGLSMDQVAALTRKLGQKKFSYCIMNLVGPDDLAKELERTFI